jgi:hypothetical protein
MARAGLLVTGQQKMGRTGAANNRLVATGCITAATGTSGAQRNGKFTRSV